MRLALKFTVAFLAGLCVVLAVYAYEISRREIAYFETDMKRDQHVLGYALGMAVREIWESSGQAAAIHFIDQANHDESHHQVSVRWVSMEAGSEPKHQPHVQGELLGELRRGHEVTWIDRQGKNVGRLYTYVPESIRGAGTGFVEVSESLDEQRLYIRSTIVRILIATGSVVGVSSLLSLILGLRLVGHPVQNLIQSVRRVADGDFSKRLHLDQHDELGELATELNTMCDQLAVARNRIADETAVRIATIEQLRHADRLKTVGQLASGIAHELGTPLNVVWARAKMIGTGEAGSAEIADTARIIAEQTERMTRIIRQLLEFARPQPPRRTDADLYQITLQTLAMLKSMADKRRVTFVVPDEETPVFAQVDPAQIQQVLSNLVVNGIQAMESGGTLTIGFHSERIHPPADVAAGEDEYICLSVADQGKGISDANLSRVFEPFFTTKDVGEGTGLGLSVSRGIIREHGGWISVESHVGQGSRFCVYLPRESRPCPAES